MEVKVIEKSNNTVLSKGNILEKKLRVAAYARVSTDSDEQSTSFYSQQKYYMDKILANPNWSFVEVYADEGISGTQAFKRDNFLRMIKDAKEGGIDLILTKSISRFARNTLDTLKYVRLLKEANVAILFEEENINTLDMSGELLLTVLSSVAQQESETIGSHVKLGLKMKMKRGELIGNGGAYGYVCKIKEGKYEINEKEAETVRFIFNSYLEGYGGATIAKMLGNMKVPSPTGKSHWCENTVLWILRNEKYIGDVILGKSYTLDSITHKKIKNRGEEDMYHFKDHHEAIIDKETFDKVQEILKSRAGGKAPGTKIIKKFTFSGKFRCGLCGASYIKKSLYKRNQAWDCNSVAGKGRMYCKYSKLMHDETIKKCFMEAYYLLTQDEGSALDTFMKNVAEAQRSSEPFDMRNKIKDKLEQSENQMSKLIDLYVAGNINSDLFNKKQEQIQNKIEKLKMNMRSVETIISSEDKIENGIKKIKEQLVAVDAKNGPLEFDDELFDALVDYGIIGCINENGENESYMIRFICKSKYNYKTRYDLTDDFIVENSDLRNENIALIPIIDFISNQHFFVFDIENGRRIKKLITKVRVRVEIER